MKKVLLYTAVLCILSAFAPAQAQDKRTTEFGVEQRTNALEVGAEYLMPQGNFSNVYDNGFGAAVRYRLGLTANNSMIASIGYMRFKGQVVLAGNNPAADVNANFIPLKIGLKFRFLKYIYAAGEIGGTISLGVNGTDQINSLVVDQYRIKGFLLNFAPTIGVQIPVKAKNYLDLGIRYEGMTSGDPFYFTGIRAAYAFNLAR